MIDFGFDPAAVFSSIFAPLQILFINLLLSGDNALVIALACRGLPSADVRKAMLFGTSGAIVLRIAMGSVALLLIRIPFLRVAAGVILVVIAIRLTLQRDDPETLAALDADPVSEEDALRRARADLLSAVWAIIVADVAMSVGAALSSEPTMSAFDC